MCNMILLLTRSGFFQRGEGLFGFVCPDSMAGKHSDPVAEMLLDPGADMLCPPVVGGPFRLNEFFGDPKRVFEASHHKC